MKNPATRILLPLLLCCVLLTWQGEKALAEMPATSTKSPDRALQLLQQQAASLSSLSCVFTQESTIPLFAQPVISLGKLLFKRPDKLVWQYAEPVQSAFVLNGSTGFRWEDSKEKRIPFNTTSDPVASFVGTQLLSWIRFDLESIRAQYTIELQSDAPLSLLLTPVKEETRSALQSLHIVFDSQGVAQIVTLSEAQGGTTVIRFSEVQINAPVNDEAFE